MNQGGGQNQDGGQWPRPPPQQAQENKGFLKYD
jgi:hypothetical protein